MKQKNSLRSGINISKWLFPAGLAVVFGLVHGFGGTLSAVAGIYLGYKLLKLVLRVLGLLFSLFLSVASIVILILIISLLIF